jgi:hypothetical protein
MMPRFILSQLLLLAIVCCPAHASIFELDDYTISAHSSDPGLVIETSDLLGEPYEFDLATVGSSTTVDLFRIWTNETVVNGGEDTDAKPISVDFSFIAPPPEFGGTSTGETDGLRGFVFIIPFGAGSLVWDAPLELAFGPLSDGLLQIELSNAIFNAGLGFGGLTPGESHGATVEATFTLLAEATGLPGPPGGGVVPEPATAFVWSALAALGLLVAIRKGRE